MNNEIIELLEGKNGYQNWASVSAPIDWKRVVPILLQEQESVRIRAQHGAHRNEEEK